MGFVRPDPELAVPDDDEHAHAFICENDQHTFQLTPKAIQAALESGDADAGTSRADRRPLVVRCPECNEMSGLRAGKCPQCGSWRLPHLPCAECARRQSTGR